MQRHAISIIAAAALMTLQAVLLAALAADGAHAAGTTAYRCHDGARVTYQSHPCPEGRQHVLQVHATPEAEAATPAARPSKGTKKRLHSQAARQPKVRTTARERGSKASRRTLAGASDTAGALTAHRIGQRPFEHRGLEVTPSPHERPRKRSVNARFMAARTPDVGMPVASALREGH